MSAYRETTSSLVAVARADEVSAHPQVVLHPYGVTRVEVRTGSRRVVLAGVDDTREPVSWAWGYVAADDPTPQVWFDTRTGIRTVRGTARRLSARVWAAQAPGRWTNVRVH